MSEMLWTAWTPKHVVAYDGVKDLSTWTDANSTTCATLKENYENCPIRQNAYGLKCGKLYSCSQSEEAACECRDSYSVNRSFVTNTNDADYVLQCGLRTQNLKNGTDTAFVQ